MLVFDSEERHPAFSHDLGVSSGRRRCPVVLLGGPTAARGVSAVTIPDGWFRGKKAQLKSTAEADWVRIEGETEFCVRDGKIISETGYDQRDLQYVYNLL